MKKLLILSAIVLYSIIGNSQELTRIDFDKLIHDFGQIKEADGPVSYKFVFKNIGKKDLIIKEVKASCGCTTPSWTKEAVKPGKTGYVAVIFDPRARKESFEKAITVTSNTSPNKTYLRIKGYVIAKPKTILDDYPLAIGNLRFKARHIAYGEVYSHSIDTGYIYIYNPTNQKIRIISIDAPRHVIYKRLPVVIFPKQEYRLQVCYDVSQKKKLGYIHDRLILKTDDKLVPEKDINLVANVKQDFSKMTEQEYANTARIVFNELEHNFGKIKKGEIVKYPFKFKNEGKTNLVIYHIKSSCGCTGSTLGKSHLEPGETGIINVKFDSKGKKGMVVNSLTVLTNDPTKSAVVLKIIANVIEPENN